MFWVPLNALYQQAGVRRKQDSLGLIIIVKAKSSVLGGLVIEDQQQTSNILFSAPRPGCLRYHGTPKLTMFSKNTLLSFSDRYYSNLSFTKSFRKERLFLRKVMDEKRFVALIFSNHVLTVICQQR